MQCGFRALYIADVLHSLLSWFPVPPELLYPKKGAVAHVCSSTLPKVVTPSPCPRNSGSWLSRRDTLRRLWMMGGNSGCFMVLLVISAAPAEARLSPCRGGICQGLAVSPLLPQYSPCRNKGIQKATSVRGWGT